MPIGFSLAIGIEALTVLCFVLQARSMDPLIMLMPSPFVTLGVGTAFAALFASTYWWGP